MSTQQRNRAPKPVRSLVWSFLVLGGLLLLLIAVPVTEWLSVRGHQVIALWSHGGNEPGGGEVPAEPAPAPGEPQTGDDTAQWLVAPGATAQVGRGTLYRYRVEVQRSTGLDATAVADVVDYALGNPRGWTNDGVAFQRVDSAEVDIVIRVATPSTVDELCAPMDTNGEVSCRNGLYVVLNLTRWNDGVDAYAGDIGSYRILAVNHEVGHAIGHAGHPPCPGPGQPSPVMMQVYYTGLQGCVANIWPYAQDGGYIG
jgi:Protein of unknown function (DUF3152)